MSHDITVRASGKAEMAYVGELPWHKLGQPLTRDADLDTWKREAGLDWVAELTVPQYHNHDGLLLPFDKHRVVYRSDTCAPIGMVSDKFKPVQPADVLEFFRDMTESGGWHIHTAGTLRGGSKIWAMASQNLEAAVKRHDKVRGNLLLATSLDGSMKTTAKLTSTRVVCANTLAIALRHLQGAVTVSHRSEFDPQLVKEAMGVAPDAFAEFMAKARRMAEQPIGGSDALGVLRDLFGQPTESEIKESATDFEFQQLMAQFATPGMKLREQRSVQRSLALFDGGGLGSALPGSEGTRWGLLNAVTQHVDHEMGRTDDTRMDSAWFGRGDEVKRKALDLLEA